MYKFAAIGALIAALAVPASAAAGQRVRAGYALDRAPCPQTTVFRPGRNYAMCGGRFWIRDSQTGKVVPVPFWRLQQPNLADQPDRP
jgi:hypothetical protein